MLVVEISCPGSMFTDWIDKMGQYADAGIPQYWIIQFYGNGSPHLYTFELVDGAYEKHRYWSNGVDIEVAGVRVRFDVKNLM